MLNPWCECTAAESCAAGDRVDVSNDMVAVRLDLAVQQRLPRATVQALGRGERKPNRVRSANKSMLLTQFFVSGRLQACPGVFDQQGERVPLP